MLFFSLLVQTIFTFFQDGVWVLGFFYLLNKLWENERLKYVSKYVTLIVLAVLLIHLVIREMGMIFH